MKKFEKIIMGKTIIVNARKELQGHFLRKINVDGLSIIKMY